MNKHVEKLEKDARAATKTVQELAKYRREKSKAILRVEKHLARLEKTRDEDEDCDYRDVSAKAEAFELALKMLGEA